MDLQYRKEWDKMVIALDVIDSDPDTGSEVVHWITHFPYPMYPREYVYIRRAKVHLDEKLMILNSRAVVHPSRPFPSPHVTVDVYSSEMVIRAHGNFEQHGLDYVMTYFDDPQSSFPTPAYKWLVKYGVPGFVDKVYCAAKALHEDVKQQTKVVEEYSNPRSKRVTKYVDESSAMSSTPSMYST